MKKRKYYNFYKVFIFLLVLLLNMNSIGAVVSDNDGSAFISKAEFDSLKTNFQSELDKKNSSISDKIDNAISSYLAGITFSQTPTDVFTRVKSALGEVRFLNSIKTTTSTITTAEQLNLYRHWFQNRYSNLQFITALYCAYKDTKTFNWTYSVAIVKNGTSGSYSDNTNTTYVAQNRVGKGWGGAAGQAKGVWFFGPSEDFNEFGTQTGLGSKNVYGTSNTSTSTAGSGTVYRYRTTPAGRKVVTEYDTLFYPSININIYAHSYMNYATNFKTNYTGSNLQRDVTTLSCTIGASELLKFGSLGTGTPFPATYGVNTSERTATTRWNAQVYNVSTSDGVAYERMIWGNVPGNIYCIDENAALQAGTTKTKAATDTQSTIDAEDWTSSTGMVTKGATLSGVAATYTPPKFTTSSKSIGEFTNDYISTLFGETVYHGQGIKIATVYQSDNLRVVLKFKNANSENAQLRYILTNGKVGATGTTVLSDWTNVNCNGSTTVTKTIDFPSKGDLWINCYSNTSGVDLILDDVEVTIAS